MNKTALENFQKYSGIAGVIVLWVSIGVSMLRTGLGFVDNRPISYLGVDPSSATLFTISLLVSAFLFMNFALFVNARFKVHNRFLMYVSIGLIGQIIAAIAPYGEHSPTKTIHTIAAFVLAFSLPFLMRQFTISQSSSSYFHLYKKLLRFEQLTFIIGIGLFVFTRGVAPLGEALPTIGYHFWIIVLTYITIAQKSS